MEVFPAVTVAGWDCVRCPVSDQSFRRMKQLLLVAGNSNLVYAIIRKRNVFHQLANLPTDPTAIQKALQRKKKSAEPISRTNSQEGMSMEGSRPAAPAEPGTLKASLIATPGMVCSTSVPPATPGHSSPNYARPPPPRHTSHGWALHSTHYLSALSSLWSPVTTLAWDTG